MKQANTSTGIDWLVLTAANSAQARSYRVQLRQRERAGLLRQVKRWQVVADPGGRRVGSGGSTLHVLHEIGSALRQANPDAGSLEALFAGQRVVVIHSGGDARRLATYAAQGKVFTPLPCTVPGVEQAAPATLFDLILANLTALPAPAAGQVLLAAGDVLLNFDPSAVDFDRPGVVGVAYPGPAERGARHGVYVADGEEEVLDFLQKPDAETAARHGAVDAVGRVLVDTGLVSLDPATAASWLTMAGVSLPRSRSSAKATLPLGPGLLRDLHAGRASAIDLYEQMLMALPPRQDEASYLAAMGRSRTRQDLDANHRRRLRRLHRGLHGQPFHVSVLPDCEFFHIGSSAELLGNVSTLNRTAAHYHFANFHQSVVADQASLEGAFVYNCLLENPKVNAGGGVLIEASHVREPIALAGRNLVVGWPAEAGVELRLPQGWGVVCMPVQARRGEGEDDLWTAVLFGIHDDFKTPLHAGGTFGNEPMQTWLDRLSLTPEALWPRGAADQRTLWEARLWCVGPIRQVLEQTLWLARAHREGQRPPASWRQRRRASLAQLLKRIDHERLVAHRQEIQRLVGVRRLRDRLEAEPWLPAAAVVADLHDAHEAGAALTQVQACLRRAATPVQEACWHRLGQAIVERFPAVAKRKSVASAEGWEQTAFEAVARCVSHQVARPEPPTTLPILHDQAVWVRTPVRLDFAGGWSDTPPICTELGGTVLNAAITLNGQYPVQVIAKRSREPRITLHSIDLGQRLQLTNAAELSDPLSPHDWAALPKAALRLAGLVPAAAGNRSLKQHLEQLGGGLDITLFSALPKGSGLGTSSVLGAAMLACLARVRGERVSTEQLIARTSLLEQMMTTAGGWQDQVGAITPGIKLVRTAPGFEQRPSLHWTALDFTGTGDLGDRTLLYFTGIQRLAKNILQKVVGRYLARDPEAVRIMHALKAGAEQMKTDLDTGDLAGFARGVETYWSLKQQLDPGSTNSQIEGLLKPVNRYLQARLLPGAGGGGFVFMIARDAEAARTVRRRLTTRPPNPQARFFNFAVDREGLVVTVL